MTFWSCTKNNSIRKIKLISKSTRPEPDKKTIATDLFPNMSRSKGNQAVKFDQLIEYNIRNIFVEKLYTKYGGETISCSLSKKSKLSISLNQLCKLLNSLFLLYAKLRAMKIK